MKKFITLMLVFLLAFGCVAGCGEDEVQKETDGNNTTKANYRCYKHNSKNVGGGKV